MSRDARTDVVLLKLEPDYGDSELAPPFGILYLASSLRQDGFTVKIYHEKGTRQNLRKIEEEILNRQPIFVGISTMTGPSLLPSASLSKRIKKRSGIPVVWGGLHATMLPDETLANGFIDIIGIGEGEETIVELARLFSEGDGKPRLERIRGIGYREDGRVRINPPRAFIRDLDRYSPAWGEYSLERYIYRGKYFYSEMGSKLPGDRIAAVITSRGCPWRCAYCYNQFVNRRTFRAHSAKRAAEDVEYLKKAYGITAVVFEDDDFFADPKRALEIIQKIRLPWSSSIRANDLAKGGEAFVRQLRDSGCVELRIGAESGTQRILDLVQKDIQVDDIHRSVELCQKSDIHALLNFMVGIPGETWAEMGQTFDLMDELEASAPGDVVINGPSIYFPWPGTVLFDLAVRGGFCPPQKLEEWAVGWRPGQRLGPYVPKKVKYAGYYRILAFRKDPASLRLPGLAKILRWLARRRWKKRFFRLPLDYYLPHLARQFLGSLGLGKILRAGGG